MSRVYVTLTLAMPYTLELGLQIASKVDEIIEKLWQESADEWSYGFKRCVELWRAEQKGVYATDEISIAFRHSPLASSHTGMRIGICTETGDRLVTEIILSIRPECFREDRGIRERVRLLSEWSAFHPETNRTPDPPREGRYLRWWRNYEEAYQADDDVGSINFRYFVSIINHIKESFPILKHEEEEELQEYRRELS